MKFYQNLHDGRQTVEALIEGELQQLNTALLAKVVSANPGNNLITVELLSKRSYLDENQDRQYVQLDNLDVRLAYQKGFKPTTKPGDFGFVIVMQSDLDPFISGGADSPRKYDLLDGIFIPMQYGNVNGTDVLISSNPGEKIQITSGSDFDVQATNVEFTVTKCKVSNGTDDLVELIEDLANVCQQITVNTTTGVLNPGIASQFAAIKSKVEAFVE